jgi:hypothetical protein
MTVRLLVLLFFFAGIFSLLRFPEFAANDFDGRADLTAGLARTSTAPNAYLAHSDRPRISGMAGALVEPIARYRRAARGRTTDGIDAVARAAHFNLAPGNYAIAQNAHPLIVERDPFSPQIRRSQSGEFFFWKERNGHGKRNCIRSGGRMDWNRQER